MSTEELIGRLVLQRRDAERRQTLAETTARQIAQALRAIAAMLDAGRVIDPVDLEKQLALLPTAPGVRDIFREIEAAREAKDKAIHDLQEVESVS